MAGQSIDATFAAILKDCQAVAVEAVKNAAKKAQDDIMQEAQSYLQKYYTGYKPTSYRRTKYLKNAITPIFEDNSAGNRFSFEVGVKYDANKLKNHYFSNSRFHESGDTWRSVTDHYKFSSDNGIPEPEWIMENFLKGIHPITEFDEGKDQYVYKPKKDSVSTNSLMKNFFNKQLEQRINQYIREEMSNIIERKL